MFRAPARSLRHNPQSSVFSEVETARVTTRADPPPNCAGFRPGYGTEMSVTTPAPKTEGGVGETVRVVIHALLIALVIRTFLFQPFNIPSGSMKATLLVGDYLFVSKFSYGYSHYSIPLSPRLFTGRIFGSDPERGDIVVFRLPKDDSTDYIKRVIGLPGDRIQMKEGLLHINDKPIQRERLADFVGEDPCGTDATARVKRWKETLPNGVTYEDARLRR